MINVFKRSRKKNNDSQDQLPAIDEPAIDSPEISQEKETKRVKDRDLFKSLLAGLYDGILIIDSRGLLIQSNQRARKFFGYTEEDLWNINCTQLIPQLSPQVIFKIKALIKKNRHTVLNAICKRQDETQFPAEIAISSINMINDDDLVLSIRNCEKRIKAQKLNQLRTDTIEYAGAGMIFCTKDGNIKYANPAFLRMVMAENMKDVLRHNIRDFCPNKNNLKDLLSYPSLNAAWYGKMDLITMRGSPLQIQATSVLTEKYSDKKRKRNIIITMTILPDTSSRATII